MLKNDKFRKYMIRHNFNGQPYVSGILRFGTRLKMGWRGYWAVTNLGTSRLLTRVE